MKALVVLALVFVAVSCGYDETITTCTPTADGGTRCVETGG